MFLEIRSGSSSFSFTCLQFPSRYFTFSATTPSLCLLSFVYDPLLFPLPKSFHSVLPFLPFISRLFLSQHSITPWRASSPSPSPWFLTLTLSWSLLWTLKLDWALLRLLMQAQPLLNDPPVIQSVSSSMHLLLHLLRFVRDSAVSKARQSSIWARWKKYTFLTTQRKNTKDSLPIFNENLFNVRMCYAQNIQTHTIIHHNSGFLVVVV